MSLSPGGARPKLGVFVGEEGNWSFFTELFEGLKRDFDPIVHETREVRVPLLRGRLNRWAFPRQIEAVLRRSDVAFFEWSSELLVPASRMPKYCPIVTRLHSYELFHWAPLIEWGAVDRIIVTSKAIQEKFCAQYSDHADRTVLIYNGRPLDHFRPAEREFEFKIGMLCSLKPRKRVYEMILALADLHREGLEPQLHVAGGRLHGYDNNLYYAALHRLVEKLGLAEFVTFHGHVDGTADWLRGMDIFISNSFWEGQQHALIEAMASGCHCLSHFWDGVEEMLPADNIYAGDRELVRKLMEYAELPCEEKEQRRARMRELAVTHFDLARQIEDINRTVIGTLEAAPRHG